jgi:hypothetical protein
VHADLHDWDQRVLKRPKRRIDQLKMELEGLRRGPMSDESIADPKEILLKIELLLEQEGLHWVQRGRANWLRHGDSNTSFFHNFASACKKKNTIKHLIDNSGHKWEDPQGMSNLIKFYFEELFTREVNEPSDEVLQKVSMRVTTEMNNSLCRRFSVEEVNKALFQIGDLKAPGPDGLHVVFYKRYWSLLGEDLKREVLQAVNSGIIPEGWNDTVVVLITKVENAENITQFRPISLCNIVYKVI